jgi:hypothetical protein
MTDDRQFGHPACAFPVTRGFEYVYEVTSSRPRVDLLRPFAAERVLMAVRTSRSRMDILMPSGLHCPFEMEELDSNGRSLGYERS